ncbi:MAG: hypothetical protein PVF17_09710 [Ignavibacteria bacterium]|jgi:hypothetical protein
MRIKERYLKAKKSGYKGTFEKFIEDEQRIVSEAEKLRIYDKNQDHFKDKTFKTININLMFFKHLARNEMTKTLMLSEIYQQTFDFAIRYNLLHPVDQKEHQQQLLILKCDLFDEEEKKGDV